MTSLADELLAVTSKTEKSGDMSKSSTNLENLENDPNSTNTYLAQTNFPYVQEQHNVHSKTTPFCYAANNADDMDITCDVTLAAMNKSKLTYDLGMESNNTLSVQASCMEETFALNIKDHAKTAQEIVMDETIVAHTKKNTHFECGKFSETSELDDQHEKIGEKLIPNSLALSTDEDKETLVGIKNFTEETIGRSSCVWSEISTDFDPDEETVNFGTRYALEADGKLFDVFTYATIEPKVSNFGGRG